MGMYRCLAALLPLAAVNAQVTTLLVTVTARQESVLTVAMPTNLVIDFVPRK